MAGVSTRAPDATPTTPTCPSGEFPSAGALDITDGPSYGSACSPYETCRTVIGASDSIVLIDEQGPDGMRTVAFDAGTGVEGWHGSIVSAPNPVSNSSSLDQIYQTFRNTPENGRHCRTRFSCLTNVRF